MITTLNSLKHFPGPVRATKWPLKLLLLGVFVFVGLLFTNQAILGYTTFFDFDDYDTGTIVGQDGWSGIGPAEVSETQATSGTKSLYTSQCGGVEYTERDLGFELDGFSYWYFPDGATSKIPYWEFYDIENNSLFYKSLGDSGLTTSVWHYWSVEIDSENHLFRETNEATSTGWLAWQNATTSIYKIRLHGTGAVPCQNYIDDLEFDVNCDIFETYYTCSNAGCYWYYSPWLQESSCVDEPPGECESGIDTCQNCNTTSTCEATEYCYWFDNSCRYGTGVCNEGLEIQFCENQSECETAGGYWYSDFCWLSPLIDFSSWADYYSVYGDYATPSAWISNMASTTAVFWGSMAGFLTMFETNFDVMEAYEKGENLGNVIPQARGYLTLFDDFLGGFPVSEFFVFLLVFMMAIGIFRIIRNIFQLIKFW